MDESPLYFTDESTDTFVRFKLDSGVSATAVSSYTNAFGNLKKWLGEDPALTSWRLQQWRLYLDSAGYSKYTVQGYVRRINDYLRHGGRPELCIPKPLRNDLRGKTFGSLTVLEPTGRRNRRDMIWRCRCSCGRESEYISHQLVSGNARTCPFCSYSACTRYRFRIAEDTSILRALKDDAISKHSYSGYTGVYRKRDKWIAVVIYKKERYYLGSFARMEDAIRARAEMKEYILADGLRMEKEYAHVFVRKPGIPAPQPLSPRSEPEPVLIAANRTDNTSGHRGVSRHRDKWYAKINYKGTRYHLGTYDLREDAVAARVLAEECVRTGEIEKLKLLHTGR